MSTPPDRPSPEPTIQRAVEVLNAAFRADPAAIHSLIVNRVPCTTKLLDDPYVIVENAKVVATEDGSSLMVVGMLGVLNGVLEAMTGKRVALKWEEPKEHGAAGRVLGFAVYDPETGKVE